MKIKTIICLAIFSIAMGFMESAIVIYLRKIYYPDGFQFPLVPLEASIGLVELLREVATIIMLLVVGILSAKQVSLRFASFLICFAIWDLFYYFFLWLIIGWPKSLFTWDILFLIPVPWAGPVITPCIVSITMILLASIIIHFQKSGLITRLKLREWILFSAGSFTIVLSFIWDYLRYINKLNSTDVVNTLSGEHNMFSEILDYVPVSFNWTLFFTGESIILYGIIIFIIRLRKVKIFKINSFATPDILDHLQQK